MAGRGSRTPVALPERHVARPRLVDRVCRYRATAVAAPGGYGKSVLAAEVASVHLGEVVVVDLIDEDGDAPAVLERILAPVGLEAAAAPPSPEVVEAVRRGFGRRRSPILLVLDDTGRAHAEAVMAVADALPAPHRLLVLGRTPVVGDAEWRAAPDRLVLGRDDLALTTPETQRLLGDDLLLVLPDGLVEDLRGSTDGWVTALQALAALLAGVTSPVAVAREVLADNLVLDALVDRLLAGLDQEQRDDLGHAAGLPTLDAALAVAIGVDQAVRAAHAAGVPWHVPDVGPWHVADPIADHLARTAGHDHDVARRAADAYVARGLPLDAVAVLRRAGLTEDAARVLAEAPTPLLRSDPVRVITAIGSLPEPARQAHPHVEVQLVRMLTARSAYPRRNSLITDLVPTVAEAHPDVARALEAERFRDLAYFSPEPDPTAMDRIRDLMGEVGDDHATRARLEEGLALLTLRAGAPDAPARAAEGLRRAAAAFDLADDDELVVLTLRNLAWHVHLEAGRLDLVLETFDDIEARVPPGSRQVAVWRINRAETHLVRGDLDRAAADLEQATREAELHHDDLHLGYAAWATVLLESMRDEAMRTLAALGRADRLTGDWFDTTTGALYLAQTTDALARVGLEREARDRLDDAMRRREEDPRAVDTAAMGVEARLGDVDRALALHDSLLTEGVEPFETPRLALLAAYAKHRRGDADAATAAARAFVAYTAQDLRDAAAVHEPTACRALAPLAAALGAPVPRRTTPNAGTGDGATADAEPHPELLARRLGLRDREAEVLLALRTGGTNADIADELGISPGTVRKHLQRAYAHLGLRSRSEALVLLSRMDGQR